MSVWLDSMNERFFEAELDIQRQRYEDDTPQRDREHRYEQREEARHDAREDER